MTPPNGIAEKMTMANDPAPDLDKLRNALQNLVDEQNGPPLIARAPQWYEAMALACESLGNNESAEYYRKEARR